MSKTKSSRDTDFNWPPFAIFALLIGFGLAIYIVRAPGRNGVAKLFQQIQPWLTWRSQPSTADLGQALIVTANSRDLLTVITTLSPRGFHPLLAGSEQEVRALIHANPGSVKLAVIDSDLPDYAGIAHTLRSVLPADNIVVLRGSRRSEDIALLLLDRLGSLRKVRRMNPVAAPPPSMAVAEISVSQ